VSDVLSVSGPVTVDCGVSFPYSLVSGDSLVCSYDADLGGAIDQTNQATVSASGLVGGGIAEAEVAFGDPSTVVGEDTITVVDSNGSSWQFSDSGMVTYERTFDCANLNYDSSFHAMYQHLNTVSVSEIAGLGDQATVTVHCYQLAVSKSADTSVDRTYEWAVSKVGSDLNGEPVTELDLSPGQQYQLGYTVAVDLSGSSDDNFAVSGAISVSNPAPMAAAILGVTDQLADAIGMQVDCSAVFPFQLAAGSSLSCSYSAGLPDAASRTNVASATLQNFAYSATGSATTSATSTFQGSATVDFADPALASESDTCVDVSDTFTGPLGTVCLGDFLPAEFTYDRMIGPYSEPDDCGQPITVDNTATIVTEDSGQSADSEWDVTVNLRCTTDGGCTLTPGYWKTHSIYGPAPYDDTWGQVGEDTWFFYAEDEYGTPQSYYQVLWTSPQGGNAYYILAHAWIAAYLNTLNGASVPDEVAVAMAQAEAWFDDPDHTPDYAAGLKGNAGREERALLLMIASYLDDYNNGVYGPGHCSE
jgi:hypothetical protein